MIDRYLLIFSASLFHILSVSGVQAQEQIEKYTVTISLSAAANQRLSSSGEMVRVWALYSGQARPGMKGDGNGEIQITSQKIDIRAPGVATLGGITLAADKMRKIRGRCRPAISATFSPARRQCASRSGAASRAATPA